MSAIAQPFPKISRHPEAIMLRFSDRRPKVSLEIAANFIVDFSADDDITGLEILWDDADRAGSESALLAFGIFSATLVWLGYHYAEHREPKMRNAALRKAQHLIAATGSPLRVALNGQTGLRILNADDQPLLCADFQYQPRRILITDSDDPVPAMPMEEIRSAIKRLRQTALPANPGAIGVTVAVAEIGNLRDNSPIHPGRWITWPEAALPGGGHASAHIAIIPPQNCAYPWLPQYFRDFPA